MLERRSTKGSSLFEAAARSFHVGITRRYKGSFERWNGIGHEKPDRSVDCSSQIGDSSHAVTFFIFDPFSRLFTRPTYRIEICWNRTTEFVAFANIDGNFVSVTNSTVFKISRIYRRWKWRKYTRTLSLKFAEIDRPVLDFHLVGYSSSLSFHAAKIDARFPLSLLFPC